MFMSNLVGWALPAYLSFKAIETPAPQDDIQWLTYWVVFGFFNFLESFALRVVLYYLPWYFAFKTVFILWLQLPAFRVSVASFRVCARHTLSVLAFFFSLGFTTRARVRISVCFRRVASPR
jgi:receptor expression-enhancing protein 5/6